MALMASISNCVVGTPFQKSSKLSDYKIKEDTVVVVALTEVETKGSISDLWTFWKRVSSVRESIESNPGYLGGSIRRQLFGSKAWTMTVWKDEESIDNFVYAKEHERAMKEGGPAVKRGRFYRIQKQWKEVPIPWEVAEELVHEEGRME
ncbi:MAG: hypothetical protein O9301_14775 [Leptospira sp.]|nr:hypothetical protein [Leptospira sp.]